jgi:hypothetical protein
LITKEGEITEAPLYFPGGVAGFISVTDPPFALVWNIYYRKEIKTL